jgi:hypothetical protein
LPIIPCTKGKYRKIIKQNYGILWLNAKCSWKLGYNTTHCQFLGSVTQ